MKNITKLLSAGLLLSVSAGVLAQQAGTIMVKAGYAYFEPIVGSGDLSAPSLPGTKVDVGNSHTEILSATYMFTDNISAELYGGIPPKHSMYGAGSINGVGVIGTVKQLPVNLFAQYRFMQASAMFRPYVGLGLNYVKFQDETGTAVLTAITNPGGGVPTTFKVKNAWGVTPQIGFTVAINQRWYIDVSINKTLVKTKTTLSTGQYIDTTLNPVVSQISVGYRF